MWLQIRADSLLWLVHKKPENHCFRAWLPCRWRVTAVRVCNFLSVSGTPTHHGMSKIWSVKADFKPKKQQKQVRSFTGRRLAVTELNFVVFIFNFKVKKSCWNSSEHRRRMNISYTWFHAFRFLQLSLNLVKMPKQWQTCMNISLMYTLDSEVMLQF